jgi:hypothetical protein
LLRTLFRGAIERGPAQSLAGLKRRAEERAAAPEPKDFFRFQTSALTLVDLMDQNPDLFFGRSDAWWVNERFATRNGEARPLELRTGTVPGSLEKTWQKQQRLLGRGEFVPTARDVVEGMVAAYRSGTRMFPDRYVRTSDVSSFGYRVGVGHFGVDGLHVSGHWDDARSSILGVAAARMP